MPVGQIQTELLRLFQDGELGVAAIGTELPGLQILGPQRVERDCG